MEGNIFLRMFISLFQGFLFIIFPAALHFPLLHRNHLPAGRCGLGNGEGDPSIFNNESSEWAG